MQQLPPTHTLLTKLQVALQASRRLTQLHSAAGNSTEHWLLHRAGRCFTLLLAAGAQPADAAAARSAGLSLADWAVLERYASQPRR